MPSNQISKFSREIDLIKPLKSELVKLSSDIYYLYILDPSRFGGPKLCLIIYTHDAEYHCSIKLHYESFIITYETTNLL